MADIVQTPSIVERFRLQLSCPPQTPLPKCEPSSQHGTTNNRNQHMSQSRLSLSDYTPWHLNNFARKNSPRKVSKKSTSRPGQSSDIVPKNDIKQRHDRKLAERRKQSLRLPGSTPSTVHPSQYGKYIGPSTMPADPQRTMHKEDKWGAIELTPATHRNQSNPLHSFTPREMEGSSAQSQNMLSTRRIRRLENEQIAMREFPFAHRGDYDDYRGNNGGDQQWGQSINQRLIGRSMSMHPGDQIYGTQIRDRDAQRMASMRGHGFQHNESMYHSGNVESGRHSGSSSFQIVSPYHGQFEQDYTRHAYTGGIGRQIVSPYQKRYRLDRTPGSQSRGYDRPRDLAPSPGQLRPGHISGFQLPGPSPSRVIQQQANSSWGNDDRGRLTEHGSENVLHGRSQSRRPQQSPHHESDPRLRISSQVQYDRRRDLGPENNAFRWNQVSIQPFERGHFRSYSVGSTASRSVRPNAPPRMPRQEAILSDDQPVARSRPRSPAPTSRNIDAHRVNNAFAHPSQDFARRTQNSIQKIPQPQNTSRADEFVKTFSKAQQKALDLTLSEDSDEETPLMNNFFNRVKANNDTLLKKLAKGQNKGKRKDKDRKAGTSPKLDKGKGKEKEVSVPSPTIAKTHISKPSTAKKSHASKGSPMVVDLVTPTPAKSPRNWPVLTMKELLPPRAERTSKVPKVARLSKAKDAVKNVQKSEEELDPKIREQIQAANKVVHRELEVERIETEKELFGEVLPESEIDKEKRLKREADEKETREKARTEALQKEALRESNRQQKLIREAIEKEERQKAQAAEEEVKRLKREEVRNSNLDIEEKLTEAKRHNAISIVTAERKQQEEEAAERERQKKQTSGFQANPEDYADLKAKQEEAKKQALSLSAKKKEKVPEKSSVETLVVQNFHSAIEDADYEYALFVPETPSLPEGQFGIAQIRQNLDAEKKLKEQQRKEKLFGNRTQADIFPPLQPGLSRPESSTERDLFAKSNKGKAPAKAKAKPKSVLFSTPLAEDYDIEDRLPFTEPSSPLPSDHNQAKSKPTSDSKGNVEEHQTPKSKKVAEDVPEIPPSAAQLRFRKNYDLLSREQIEQIVADEKRKKHELAAELEKKRLAKEQQNILLTQEEVEKIEADTKRKKAEFDALQAAKRTEAIRKRAAEKAARTKAKTFIEKKKQELIAKATEDGVTLSEEDLESQVAALVATREARRERDAANKKRKAERKLASQPSQKKPKKGPSSLSADGKDDDKDTEEARQRKAEQERKAERDRKIARARERNPAFAAAASVIDVAPYDSDKESTEEESTLPKSDDKDNSGLEDGSGSEDEFDFGNLRTSGLNSATATRPPQLLQLSKYTPTKTFAFFNGNSSKRSSLLPRYFLDRPPIASANMDDAPNTNVNIYRVLRQSTDEKGEHKPKLLDLYGGLDEANQRVFDEVTNLRLSPLKIQGVIETHDDDGLIWCQVTTDRIKGCCLTFFVEVETRMSGTLEDFDEHLFPPRFRSCIYQIVRTTILKDRALAQSSLPRLAAESTNLEKGDEDEAESTKDNHPSEAGTIQHDESEAATTQNEEIEAEVVQTEGFETGITYHQETEAGTTQNDTEMVEVGEAQIEIEAEVQNTQNYGIEAQINYFGAGQVESDERDELMDDFNALMEEDKIAIPEPPPAENIPFVPAKVTKNLAAFTNREMANHEAYTLLCAFLKPATPKIDWLEVYQDIARQLKQSLDTANEEKTEFEVELDIVPEMVPWLDVSYVETRVEKIELKGPLN